MAYWLHCQSCKQWSKSATGLSEDKFCPFCNNLFVKTKPYSLPNNSVDKAFNMPERRQASKTVELIEEDTIKTSSSRGKIETPATANDKYQLQEADEVPKVREASMAAHQDCETIEVKEVSESQEINRVVETTAAAEEQAPENPEKYDFPPVEPLVQDGRQWSKTQEAGVSSIEPVPEQEPTAVQAVNEEEFENAADAEIQIDEEIEAEKLIEAAADYETAITTETNEAFEGGEADEPNESNAETRDLKKLVEGSDKKTEIEETPNRPKMTRVHERYMETMRRTKNQHPIKPQP